MTIRENAMRDAMAELPEILRRQEMALYHTLYVFENGTVLWGTHHESGYRMVVDGEPIEYLMTVGRGDEPAQELPEDPTGTVDQAIAKMALDRIIYEFARIAGGYFEDETFED